MNINDLVKHANAFCDEIESLSKDISSMKYDDLDEYAARTKNLLQTLVRHKQNLTDYCNMYQIPKDEYLFSLLDLMLGFIKKAANLFQEEPTDRIITEIQGEIGMAEVCVDEEDYSVALKEWRKNIISTDRLSKYKKKLQKESDSLAPLVGEKISPSKTYLRPSVLNDPALQDTQTYYRSEKHPWAKQLKESNHVMYQSHDLKYGARAHLGSYGNMMQMLGDRQSVNKQVKLDTTRGTAHLYNSLLRYKNYICQYVFDQVNLKLYPLQTIKVSFFNDYPCIMVYLKPNTIMHAGVNTPSEAAFESWIDFLISYFIASVNHKVIEENGLQIEMERRSSFGYLTPTISPTGKSMRINVGVVPKWYADLLVDCLIDFDTLLKEKIINRQKLPVISDDIFYGSSKHLDYLSGKYPPNRLTNLLQVLWAPADKSGRTTLQNIVRTPYALDGIATIVFNALEDGDEHNAFNQGLTWAIKQLTIEIRGKNKTLSFKQQNSTMSYKSNVVLSTDPLDNDRFFWNTIGLIVFALKGTSDMILHEAIEGVEYCHQENDINNLYYFLEQCCELTFVSAVHQAKGKVIGDGYGSDSETESVVKGQKLYAKKVITHNGMRAIWTAIIATTHYLQQQNMSCNLCLDSSYYEAPLGVKLICDLHDLKAINVVKSASLANTLLFDLNACITDGNPNRDYTTNDKKILILDATSALTETVKAHVYRFACSRAAILFVVESGFKHQQIFSDKNQYGTIRIFTRDKKLCNKIYEKIKTIDPPLLSGTSHAHRRQMKTLGAVPVTSLFFESNAENTVDPLADVLKSSLKISI